MADFPTNENFGSSEALLRFIQERSEDIQKVVLCPPGYVLSFRGQPVGPPNPRFGLMMHFMNGERKMIFGDDIEVLLNDGILNRMGIKIELAKGAAG